MQYIIEIITILVLVFLSIIDLKTYNLSEGCIPSALTTMFILFTFLGKDDATVNIIYLIILSALIGVLLLDLNTFHGLADLKIFIALGLTTNNIIGIIILTLILLIISIIYKTIVKLIRERKGNLNNEIAYIPIMLVSYIIHLIIIL